MNTTENTFTEMILEMIFRGQRTEAIESFRAMRKDQKECVLKTLAEGIYLKERIGGEAPLCLSAIKILIHSLYH